MLINIIYMDHNLKFETTAPKYVKERNNKISKAYKNILITIDRIQGLLDDEYLRGRIESEMFKKKSIKTTVFQCTTPFIIISLGCDEMGRYNLVYSVDYRFQQMIGEVMANTLLRRIYEFTPGEMEVFVTIGSLYHDCIKTFNQMIEEMESEPFHNFYLKEKKA